MLGKTVSVSSAIGLGGFPYRKPNLDKVEGNSHHPRAIDRG